MEEVPVLRGEGTGACGGGGGEGEGGVQHQRAGSDRARSRGCAVACIGSGVEAHVQLSGALGACRLHSAAQGTELQGDPFLALEMGVIWLCRRSFPGNGN